MLRWWVCAGLATLIWATAAQASDALPLLDRAKLSLGFHYSTGKYGGTSTTEIFYVPFIARADLGNWSAQLTVPYIRISGPTGALVGGPNGLVQANGNADGLGDILARLSYTLLPCTDWMPFVDFIGRVKFPTASRSAGLGSGEFDYSFEAELSETFDAFTPFVAGGYRVLGSPPGSTYRNVALASGGAMYRLLDSLSLGLDLDYREAATASSGTRLELIPFLTWRFSEHWNADLYASAGLAKGSPDAGTGVQIGWSF